MTILIGFIIGAVLGLTGAGGSIFAVPLLILLAGFAPSEAMGIALGAVTVSALLGTVAQRRQVLWLPSALLASSGAIAAPLGKYISLLVNDSVLIIGFVSIALIIALRMLIQALQHPEIALYVRASVPDAPAASDALACRLSPTGKFQLRPRCISGLVIGGFGVGFASGLFGVGGGFLIVPLLLFLSALSMQRAIATSLAIITVISGAGFLSHIALSGANQLTATGYVLIGAVIGMLVSQRFSKRLAGPALQLIFAILLIGIALVLTLKHFFG